MKKKIFSSILAVLLITILAVTVIVKLRAGVDKEKKSSQQSQQELASREDEAKTSAAMHTTEASTQEEKEDSDDGQISDKMQELMDDDKINLKEVNPWDIPLDESQLNIIEDQDFINQFMNEMVNTDDEEAYDLDDDIVDRSVYRSNPGYDGASRNIVCWGDSMTQGIGTDERLIDIDGYQRYIYTDYPSTLEDLTGIRVRNNGIGGEDSVDIATRQGGLSMRTDRDIELSPDGMSEVAFLSDYIDRDMSFIYYGGHIDYGIYGNVVYFDEKYAANVDDDGYSKRVSLVPELTLYPTVYATLTSKSIDTTSEAAQTSQAQTSDGAKNATTSPSTSQESTTESESNTGGSHSQSSYSITIPEGTLVNTKEAIDRRNDIMILEIGSNGGWNGDYQEIIRQYDAMIDYSNCPYFIIIGDTDDPGTSDGDIYEDEFDANGDYIGLGDTAWEATLREAYGDHFINMRTYLIENGLSDCGLSPTVEDLEAAAYGFVSVRLRSDWTHLNSWGYYSKGKAVYEKGVELGYWN